MAFKFIELETRGRALEDAFFRREAEAFREQLLRGSAADPSAAGAGESGAGKRRFKFRAPDMPVGVTEPLL